MPYPFSLPPVSSASLLPRLTWLSLALPPSALTPFRPAQVTSPPTPPATCLLLAPLLVSRGISFFYGIPTAKSTTVQLRNGSPNIVTILAPRQPSIPFVKFSPPIPPGAWPCFAHVSHNTHLIPAIRPYRCWGPRGPPQLSFHHPLANAQSPGPGQLTKSFLLRNGFLEALASSGHLLQVREDTNKSGSSSLSSIIGIRALSMFRGGTPIWCPRNSFLLVSFPPTIPPSPTLVGSPTLDVVNASLPLLTPGSPPLTAGPLPLPLPSLLHPNASLPTCLVSLPYLLTIWICLIPPLSLFLPLPSPWTQALYDAASLRKQFRL